MLVGASYELVPLDRQSGSFLAARPIDGGADREDPRLGNQARAAGIVLWVQVQHAVAETLPTALRRNLATTISFRQPSGQAAALIFGDTGDFPVDITRLRRGQLLFRHGLTSEITALQAANVGLADIPTLLNGDADAPHP